MLLSASPFEKTVFDAIGLDGGGKEAQLEDVGFTVEE
jgi:hypothetical protein